MAKRRVVNKYTPEGRIEIHDNLEMDTRLLHQMMRQPIRDKSLEYADNRISLFCAQHGKCAVTGVSFETVDEIHCHHKKPKADGGSDKYENLVLVLNTVHRLIHAKNSETVEKYLVELKLDNSQMKKLNELRQMAGNEAI